MNVGQIEWLMNVGQIEWLMNVGQIEWLMNVCGTLCHVYGVESR